MHYDYTETCHEANTYNCNYNLVIIISNTNPKKNKCVCVHGCVHGCVCVWGGGGGGGGDFSHHQEHSSLLVTVTHSQLLLTPHKMLKKFLHNNYAVVGKAQEIPRSA